MSDLNIFLILTIITWSVEICLFVSQKGIIPGIWVITFGTFAFKVQSLVRIEFINRH